MAGVKWSQDPDSFLKAVVRQATVQTNANVRGILEGHVAEITAWLQANAPWKDQTGWSRAGLHAWVTVDANGKVVILHLNYTPDERWPERPVGYFLEDLKAGKYSIIRPAVDIWFAALWSEIEQAVR